MKIPIPALTLALAGCATISSPGPAGHIILDREHSLAMAYWKPSEEEVAALELRLARLMASPDRRVFGMERTKLSDYGVSYHGNVEAGKKVIIGKGELVSLRSLKALQEMNDRPEVSLGAFGGGSAFFTVVYDPATRKILSVSANAPL